MKHIKIVGNLGRAGTKVIDVDTGEEIPNVRKITWVHEAGSMPQCTIEVVGATLEAEAEFVETRKFSREEVAQWPIK